MITIITPVYNGARFIDTCIQSVIDQHYEDIEHLIIDGSSTDRTLEIVQSYAQKYPHISWVSEKDQGQSDAMNKGIMMAKGNIIGILNADDYYEPNVFARVVQLFQHLPEPGFLVGRCRVIDEQGNLKYINKPKSLNVVDILSERSQHPYNPSAYFYHKSLHQLVGFYDTNHHYVMDLDFILKAVQHSHTLLVNDIWGNYRAIEGTKTNELRALGLAEKTKQDLFAEHRKKLPLLQQILISIFSSPIYKSLGKTKNQLLKSLS